MRRLLLIFLSACSPSFEVDGPAEIRCREAKECPSGYVCITAIERCLLAEGRDGQAPALLDATLAPARARPGGEVRLSFRASEPLHATPHVVLALADADATARAFHLSTSANQTYHFTYAVRGDEPELAPVPVLVTLVDVSGNTTRDTLAGETLFDFAPDIDADGYASDDCDDGERTTHPGADESCDAVDNDCDTLVDEGFDLDGDEVRTCDDDCDDVDPQVHPGAAERCNGEDDDCDGLVDEDLRDATGRYVLTAHCGACGNDCAVGFAHAGGVCDLSPSVPVCVPVCHPGHVDVNGVAADGCECAVLSGPDAPGGGDTNCDGVDGDATAIFVSPAGNDLDAGDLAAPVRTIGKAIELAPGPGAAIYVAEGLYEESVTLVSGVALHGGFSLDFATRAPATSISEIRAPPSFSGQALGAVSCVGLTGDEVVVDGFRIRGGDAFAAGTSSYAVYALDCDAALVLTGNEIIAGSGGDGEDGASAETAIDGADGEDGTAGFTTTGLCSGVTNPGGGGGALSCGGVNVGGGAGGTAPCPVSGGCFPYLAPDPAAGEHGQAGQGPAPGAGGTAGDDSFLTNVTNCSSGTSCMSCLPGTPRHGSHGADGADGTEGASGAGCSDPLGSVVAGHWLASSAGLGGTGGPGSGGGGGGAAGGLEVNLVCTTDDEGVGSSGGGGGSGGCGGPGAEPGGGPGGSFCVFLAFSAPPASAPVISGNTLHGGAGGVGGDGGSGALGGKGGARGVGGGEGVFPLGLCTERAGPGGSGGEGGGGGGGGGACGGPAVGVFVAGHGGLTLPDYATANSDGGGFVGGAAGAGGSGGGAGNGGEPGVAGAAVFVAY